MWGRAGACGPTLEEDQGPGGAFGTGAFVRGAFIRRYILVGVDSFVCFINIIKHTKELYYNTNIYCIIVCVFFAV